MSTPSPNSNPEHEIRAAYVDQHATSRLHNWLIEKPDGSTSTALLHLSETGQLVEVLREASLPLLQAAENASRQDPHFNRLPDGTVDVILGRVVSNKQVGTLRTDTFGNVVFKPWTKAKTE